MQNPLLDTERELLSKKFDDLSITYRLYTPSDDVPLIALEKEASQGNKYVRLIADFSTIHREPFDSKCKLFPDHIIVVAEAQRPNSAQKDLCGCACLGIKEIYFNQKKVKAGVLFDLRVSERYQRKGIGATICELIEKLAAEKGCEFIYLSVNNNNNKAIFLYTKLGYSVISHRRMGFMTTPPQSHDLIPSEVEIEHNGRPVKLKFERLTREEALDSYNKFYLNQDLALVNWKELTDSQEYIGTFVAKTEDNKNTVGMTLQRIRKSGSMGLTRFFFPATYHNKLWFVSLGLTAILIAMSGFLSSIKEYVDSLNIDSFWKTLLGYIGMGLPVWLTSFVYLFINKFVLNMAGFAFRGRYIGPFKFLEDESLLRPMLEALTKYINQIAAYQGIESVMYNRDVNCEFAKNWPSIKGFNAGPYFYAKYIKPQPDSQDLKSWKPSAFMYFDARDL